MLTKVENLNELFAIELRYAYDCEQKLVRKGLPSMIEAAASSELKSALEHHLTETRRHVARLESVFSMAGVEASTKDNQILDKMISAAKDSVGNIEPSALRDTALIANGNHVEHYEIAMYGTLADFARQLGLEGAVKLFEETLAEEKAADAKLTQIGAASMNAKAARGHRAA